MAAAAKLALRTALVALSALAVAACDGSGTSKKVFLKVKSTRPAQGATDVPVDTTVEVTFDSDVDPASATQTTVFLENITPGRQGPVQGVVATSGRKVIWSIDPSSSDNQLLPQDPLLGFENDYELTVRGGPNGVVAKAGGKLVADFKLTFTTEKLTLAATAGPEQSTDEALIENVMRLTGGSSFVKEVVRATVTFDLDPTSVDDTTVKLVRKSAPAQALAGDVTYQISTKTVGFTLIATGENTTFPAEPVLEFGETYQLIVTTGVRTATAGLSPKADAVFEFTTADLAGAPGAGDLMFNEFLADPDSSGATQPDANGDGFFHDSLDEFVEVLNLTGGYLDLGVHTIISLDSSGTDVPFFAFPPNELTSLVPPRRAIVVFTGFDDPQNPGQAGAEGPFPDDYLQVIDIGGSRALGTGRTSSNLDAQFLNAGDTIRLEDDTANVLATVTYPGPDTSNLTIANESYQRAVDGDDAALFVDHTSAQGGLGSPHSPGNRADGSHFTQ